MTTKFLKHLGLNETAWNTAVEAAAVLRCSRSFIYELSARGHLKRSQQECPIPSPRV